MKIRKEYIWKQLDATTEMTVSRQKASNLWKKYISKISGSVTIKCNQSCVVPQHYNIILVHELKE